jgi:hypothetical protein
MQSMVFLVIPRWGKMHTRRKCLTIFESENQTPGTVICIIAPMTGRSADPWMGLASRGMTFQGRTCIVHAARIISDVMFLGARHSSLAFSSLASPTKSFIEM